MENTNVQPKMIVYLSEMLVFMRRPDLHFQIQIKHVFFKCMVTKINTLIIMVTVKVWLVISHVLYGWSLLGQIGVAQVWKMRYVQVLTLLPSNLDYDWQQYFTGNLKGSKILVGFIWIWLLQSLFSSWRIGDTFRIVWHIGTFFHSNLMSNYDCGGAVGSSKSTPKFLHVVLIWKMKEWANFSWFVIWCSTKATILSAKAYMVTIPSVIIVIPVITVMIMVDDYICTTATARLIQEKVTSIFGAKKCGSMRTRKWGYRRISTAVHWKVHGRWPQIICRESPWSLDGGWGGGWCARSVEEDILTQTIDKRNHTLKIRHKIRHTHTVCEGVMLKTFQQQYDVAEVLEGEGTIFGRGFNNCSTLW